MNKARKARWLRDLRSGQFKQANNTMAKIDEKGRRSYCCLGVLACKTKGIKIEMQDENGTVSATAAKISVPMTLSDIGKLEWLGPVTPHIQHLFGGPTEERTLANLQDHLTSMNDVDNKSFKQIAKWIEGNL